MSAQLKICSTNLLLIVLLLVAMEATLGRRRSRSMLKIEELKTSKEFLMKFINDSPSIPQRQFCRGKFIKQVISHPGCISKPIINKMCYGMCKSAYIPEVRNNKPKGTICVQCQPASMLWMTVALQCPKQPQKVVYKKVRKIRKCHCWSKDLIVKPYRMIPDPKSVMKVIAWLKALR